MSSTAGARCRAFGNTSRTKRPERRSGHASMKRRPADTKRGRRPSASAIAIGTRALKNWQAKRASLPRCGAMARSTGQPCQLEAMANGRCCHHGGKTPSGDQWHKTQWPKRSAPDLEQKFERKLKALQKAAKTRASRLAVMTPDERARHEEWQRAHRPGSTLSRAAARARREQVREAAELFSREVTRSQDPEWERIQRRIDELERQLAPPTASIFD